MRYIVLDTETTGLDPDDGHRIIEIGCIEIFNRNITENTFHKYINPERESDKDALKVHGLDQSFLSKQPKFEEIANKLIEFLGDAKIVAHNANFDVSFLNNEFEKHEGRKCYGCGKCPIIGPVFICTITKVEYCAMCEERATHPYPLLKVNTPKEIPVSMCYDMEKRLPNGKEYLK